MPGRSTWMAPPLSIAFCSWAREEKYRFRSAIRGLWPAWAFSPFYAAPCPRIVPVHHAATVSEKDGRRTGLFGNQSESLEPVVPFRFGSDTVSFADRCNNRPGRLLPNSLCASIVQRSGPVGVLAGRIVMTVGDRWRERATVTGRWRTCWAGVRTE